MLYSRPAARRAARFEVELACTIIGREHDAPQLVWATDLSAAGLWLESDERSGLGEEVVVSFQPAIAWRGGEMTLFAEIARASAGRRWGDRGAGVGLRFLDLDGVNRHTLGQWLRPRRVRGGINPRRRSRRAGRQAPALSAHPFAARRC